MKSRTYEHHQLLGFLPSIALLDLHYCSLQLLHVLGLSAFSFIFSKWNTCLFGWKSGDLAIKEYSTSLSSKDIWLLWQSVLGHCAPSYQFCSIWLNLSRWNGPIYFRVSPAASVSSRIINKKKCPLADIYAHIIKLPQPCITDEVVSFGTWVITSLLHILSTILVYVDLSFDYPEDIFLERDKLFHMFSGEV